MIMKSVLDSILQLQKRVTALERKLGGRWPADICQACGSRALRLHQARSSNEKGNVEKHWRCSACGIVDVRVTRPRWRGCRGVAQRNSRGLHIRACTSACRSHSFTESST